MRRAEIERLLPQVFQRTLHSGSPLQAILEVIEDLHAPAEDVLARLPEYFNPYWAEERYLTMLAYWVNLDPIFPPRPAAAPEPDWSPRASSIPSGRLRELIASAAHLSSWRGTAYGLVRFLEIATGTQGFRLEETVVGKDGLPVPFHVRIVAPESATAQRELIERIVKLEKPAYVTWELVFEGSSQV
jgi:phage tail-like protein